MLGGQNFLRICCTASVGWLAVIKMKILLHWGLHFCARDHRELSCFMPTLSSRLFLLNRSHTIVTPLFRQREHPLSAFTAVPAENIVECVLRIYVYLKRNLSVILVYLWELSCQIYTGITERFRFKSTYVYEVHEYTIFLSKIYRHYRDVPFQIYIYTSKYMKYILYDICRHPESLRRCWDSHSPYSTLDKRVDPAKSCASIVTPSNRYARNRHASLATRAASKRFLEDGRGFTAGFGGDRQNKYTCSGGPCLPKTEKKTKPGDPPLVLVTGAASASQSSALARKEIDETLVADPDIDQSDINVTHRLGRSSLSLASGLSQQSRYGLH